MGNIIVLSVETMNDDSFVQSSRIKCPAHSEVTSPNGRWILCFSYSVEYGKISTSAVRTTSVSCMQKLFTSSYTERKGISLFWDACSSSRVLPVILSLRCVSACHPACSQVTQLMILQSARLCRETEKVPVLEACNCAWRSPRLHQTATCHWNRQC